MVLTALVTTLHVVVAVFLIMVVLLQTGKRADLAGAFGGGGSQTAFGARGAATLLSKLTTASAVMFMVTSLALSLLAPAPGSQGRDSVLPDDLPAAETQQAPPAEIPALPADAAPVPEDPTTTEDDPALPDDSN